MDLGMLRQFFILQMTVHAATCACGFCNKFNQSTQSKELLNAFCKAPNNLTGRCCFSKEGHIIGYAVFVKPCQINVIFLYPLKMSENQRFSDVFKGYRKTALVWFADLDDWADFSWPWNWYSRVDSQLIFIFGRYLCIVTVVTFEKVCMQIGERYFIGWRWYRNTTTSSR